MAFEVTKTFVVKAPASKVWAFLTDPQQVAKCLPGAAITEKLDDKTWGAELHLTSRLVEKAPGETEVTTVSKVNVTGILAQMGRGMVQDVSDQMFKVFSERMRSELESAAPAEPAVAAPPSASVAVARKSDALDLGALGARVALRRPEFWVAVGVAAVVLYLIFR